MSAQFGSGAAKTSIGTNTTKAAASFMNESVTHPSKHRMFRFVSGSHKIPHPDKAYTGGEDACFTFEDSAIGVADGVGGWAEYGVDSSVYSNALMNNTKSFFSSPLYPQSLDPATDSLQSAYERCRDIIGSSTGIVAALVGNNVKLCNVGDSRAVLLRSINTSEGKLKFKVQEFTVEQTYKFNFPYQLGTESKSTPKSTGQKYDWVLQDGDYLVLGSDGVFDNLWNEDIADIFSLNAANNDVSKLAQLVSLKAAEVAEDSFTNKTPWAVGAKKAGKYPSGVWTGGKKDDITVVVSKVEAFGSNPTLEAKL